jgi:hypothetical protein
MINKRVFGTRRSEKRHAGGTLEESHDNSTTHSVGRRDESGAVIILALVFLVAVSVMVLALAGSTSNDLANSLNFTSARTVDNAASNAIDVAIESMRYTPLLTAGSTDQTLNASPPSYCWGGPGNSQLANIDVWCSTVWNPASANTRVVTFSACQSTAGAVACALHPLLQAVVTFDDYPVGVSAPNTAQCAVYCGTGMTVNSLIWSPAVPTVTAITPTSGVITGNTPITITGTGFVSGATTVNFVQETGGNPGVSNVILTATGVSVSGSTTITASTPAATSGSTYYVTVTTPEGTSAEGPVFTYSSVTPTVSAISPNSGVFTHGTSVTITGTGFVSGATVTFTPVGGGTGAAATAVNVTNSTTITAVSPPVTGSGSESFYVTVTTPSGTSANGPVFTYT